MKTAAIIAEYNPFHNGHHHQLRTVRDRYGADRVIVIMSGDFIQRGGPAFLDKYSRARMALLAGADLVIELPAVFAVSESAIFSRGAVRLLDRLGLVDALYFGCETPDPSLFEICSDILLDEPPIFRETLQSAVREGLSYPRARALALREAFGLSFPGRLLPEGFLSSPNNILALEYHLALKQEHSVIRPVPMLRKGAGYHDTRVSGAMASASGIRKALLQDGPSPVVSQAVPAFVFEALSDGFGKAFPVVTDDFSQVFAAAFLAYADAVHPSENTYFGTDLFRRMARLFDDYTSLSQYLSLLKTKGYTKTRIDRSVFRMLLHIPRDQGRILLEGPSGWEYARILGFRKDSVDLLHAIKKAHSIPLIAKMADAPRKLPSRSLAVLKKDIYAADLYRHIQQIKFRGVLKTEWTQSVIRV